MQIIYILKGCPSSGKSSYCRELMGKEPTRFKRINNDSLRLSLDFGIYSPQNEKIIKSLREHLLKDFLKRGYDVLIDNINANAFKDICKVVSSLNLDVEVEEVPFYIELEEAIERDSKREGIAKVGAQIVAKWWKELGGKQFKHYQPKIATFHKNITGAEGFVKPMEQDASLPRAVIFDNDGTVSIPYNRNVYDASTADQDLPHAHVIECLKLYYSAGYKILFVSGRQEKDRTPTEKFYKLHFPEISYELFMRPNGNIEKDVIIKERIFNEYIKGKYFVAAWIDDRLQVCRWIYKSGLPLFRVNNPESDF